jgi:hypothetical protein
MVQDNRSRTYVAHEMIISMNTFAVLIHVNRSVFPTRVVQVETEKATTAYAIAQLRNPTARILGVTRGYAC